MIPKSENSLPSSTSDNSIHDKRFVHENTPSTSSSKSNPFTGPEDGEEIQLEDFSYIHSHIPRNESPTQKTFVKEHPSLPPVSCAGEGTSRQRCVSLDEDRAVSEWETVAPDEEFEECNELPPRQLRRQRNFELVFHAQDILDPSRKLNLAKLERNTILLPPHALPDLRKNRRAAFATTAESFHSASSLYSDLDKPHAIDGVNLLESNKNPEGVGQHDQHPVETDRHSELIALYSRASSSTSGDPFKYDGDIYSGFLQPSAERDVSDALHHAGSSGHSTERPAQSTDMEDPRTKTKRSPDAVSFYNAEAIRST
ncbi:Fc.00g016930.m01.CDS01 [Cosmosporella sp. VM-42]